MRPHARPVETMRAVLAVRGRLEDAVVPCPELRARDLLVRVHAVSVNPLDVKLLHGGSDTERVLGFDAAGEVVGVGVDVSSFSVGDAVYYAGDINRPGAHCELQAVDERVVGHMPQALSFAEAAAMPLTALTAAEALWDHLRTPAQATGSMLVVGAAGGVGSIMVQLARKFTRMRVIGTASREESARWVHAMGAHHVVDYRDLGPAVLKIVPEGIDAVFSAYSVGNIQTYADVLRPFGHVVAIDGPDRDFGSLRSKSITWHWEYVFARTTHTSSDVGRQGELLEQMGEHFDVGTLRCTATRFIGDFSARGLTEAFEAVQSGRAIGKVVVHR